MYFIQHCFICRPADSTVSEDAGIELRQWQSDALTIQLDLIHSRLDLIHTRLDFILDEIAAIITLEHKLAFMESMAPVYKWHS